MTDETNDTITETTPTYEFDAVPMTELAKTSKGADPKAVALGQAILAAVTVDTAQGDRERYEDRKGAVNRAAVIKRAIKAAGGAPAGHTIGTRIGATAEGFRVIITLTSTPASAKGGKGK